GSRKISSAKRRMGGRLEVGGYRGPSIPRQADDDCSRTPGEFLPLGFFSLFSGSRDPPCRL
ncbi:hypothetical protein FRC18_008493, partial [Serendipita sp. 400]